MTNDLYLNNLLAINHTLESIEGDLTILLTLVAVYVLLWGARWWVRAIAAMSREDLP